MYIEERAKHVILLTIIGTQHSTQILCGTSYGWSCWSRCARLPCWSGGTRGPLYSTTVCLSVTADSCWTIRALTRCARFSLWTWRTRLVLTENYKVELGVWAVRLRRRSS